jgi:sugar phosphate isomerase/epimerase
MTQASEASAQRAVGERSSSGREQAGAAGAQRAEGERRSIELGFCSISALDRPLAAVAELAVACGLDGIEATARPPHVDPAAPLETLRETAHAVRAAGARMIAYGSYLGRPELGARDAAAAEQAVRVAEALGAPLLRVWAEPDGAAREDGFAETAALLRTACDAAAAAGIDVVVERHAGSFADTPERIDRLFAAIDRPNCALNYQVLDLLPQSLAAAQPDDARRLVPLARYFHLKNVRPAADGAGPMPPGATLGGGVFDYAAILAAAFEAGYAGPLTIEFLSFEPKPVDEKLATDAAWLRRVLAGLGRA